MGLPYVAESLESIPVEVQGIYKEVESDGKKVYQLDVEGVKPASEFDKVYKALNSERNLRSQFEKTAKAFGDITPDRVQELSRDLEAYKAAVGNNPPEEYLKTIDNLKKTYQNDLSAKVSEYDKKMAELQGELQVRDKMILNIKLDNELKGIFSEKGDSKMYEPFASIARDALEWNEDRKEFRTKDGLYNANEWLNSVCYAKYPGFLKGNTSAGASEAYKADVGVAKYFDPKSSDYNKTRQAEYFKQNPEHARELLARYKNK